MDSKFTAYVPIDGKTEQFTQPTTRGDTERFTLNELRAWWAVVDVACCSSEAERKKRLKPVADSPEVFKFYYWWVQFIGRPLLAVQIGSREFHESRAGLIPTESIRHLQDAAKMTLDQFRDSTLTEVFDFIMGRQSPVEVNPWTLARGQNSKITISDQMVVLFKNDDSIVDRKGLSAAVAKILGCSASAVRHPTHATWFFYQTEQARRKKLRQELKGKRWTDSEQNDAVN